jgi:hypothetical protein
LGLISGVVVTPVFLYVSFMYAIHDGFRIAARLFPAAVLLSPDLNSLSVGTIVLALIQWPLYGLIFGYCYTNRRRSFAVAAVVALLILQHVVVCNVAAARVNALPITLKLERDLLPEVTQHNKVLPLTAR